MVKLYHNTSLIGDSPNQMLIACQTFKIISVKRGHAIKCPGVAEALVAS